MKIDRTEGNSQMSGYEGRVELDDVHFWAASVQKLSNSCDNDPNQLESLRDLILDILITDKGQGISKSLTLDGFKKLVLSLHLVDGSNLCGSDKGDFNLDKHMPPKQAYQLLKEGAKNRILIDFLLGRPGIDITKKCSCPC